MESYFFVPLFYFFFFNFNRIVRPILTNLDSCNLCSFGITYTLFLASSKVVGAILFGIRSLLVRISVIKYCVKKSHDNIRAWIHTFSVPNQVILLVNMPFPPLGIISSSMIGFSTYLIFVGIFYSAVYIAQNTSLRNFTRNASLNIFPLFLNKIAYI